MTPLPLLEFKYKLKKLPSSKALRRATSSKSRIPSDLSRRFLPNVNEMREVFDKIDRDRDGKISKKELGQVLSAMRDQDMSDLAGEMVKVADLNGDGRIDFEEFMEVNRKWGGVSAWEIKIAFFLYDFDGDGRIGAEDLEKMLTRLGEKSSPEACQKMVRCVDRTGHGLVDMDDFMTMMTKSMKTASAV